MILVDHIDYLHMVKTVPPSLLLSAGKWNRVDPSLLRVGPLAVPGRADERVAALARTGRSMPCSSSAARRRDAGSRRGAEGDRDW
jgi:hypothetical protein